MKPVPASQDRKIVHRFLEVMKKTPLLFPPNLGVDAAPLLESSSTGVPQTPTTPSNPRALFRSELEMLSDGKGTVFGSVCVMVQSIIGGGLLAYPAGRLLYD